MSFRLYVYYCAVAGGWAALVGFLLGTLVAPVNPLGRAGILGLFFGTALAGVLTFLNALRELGPKELVWVFARSLAAAFVGVLAGLLGGILAHVLGNVSAALVVVGWGLAGAMIGASLAICEIVAGLIHQTDITVAKKKLVRGSIGGGLGGLLGGILAVLLAALITSMLRDRDASWLWSPRAMGFVAMGMAIGTMVSLLQFDKNKVV